MSEVKEEKKSAFGRLVNEIRELAVTVLIFIPIYLIVYIFAYELRSIPSESMVPTLQVGDRVAVSKFTYGYSRDSLPLGLGRVLPLGDGRIFAQQPKHGDIVVFKHTYLNRTMIKRLIGLPGDEISVQNNRIFLNGEMLEQKALRRVVYRDARDKKLLQADELMETMPNGKSYLVHNIQGKAKRNSATFIVPEGHYFFMGDNRDNSADSRERTGHCPPDENNVIDRAGCEPRLLPKEEPTIGFVPFQNIIGRADTVLFTFNFCDRYESGCNKGRVWKSL